VPPHSLLPADNLPPNLARLLAVDLPPVGPGQPRHAFTAVLEAADPSAWCGEASPQSPAAACCESGLWLWNGFLDRSHQISQEIGSAEGSWWHGIMHRREPDAGNAAYWFRKVGDHPRFGSLAAAVRRLVAGRSLPTAGQWLATIEHWDPFQLIDLCETARRSPDDDLRMLTQEVAALEWYELFDHCRQQATAA
jgi:hypothetical protein